MRSKAVHCGEYITRSDLKGQKSETETRSRTFQSDSVRWQGRVAVSRPSESKRSAEILRVAADEEMVSSGRGKCSNSYLLSYHFCFTSRGPSKSNVPSEPV